MRARLLIAMLAALPAPLAAQPRDPDWRVAVTDGADGTGRAEASVAFIDFNSVRRQGEIVDFTLEVRFSLRRAGNGPDGLRSVMRADCGGMRWSSSSTTSYRGAAAVESYGATPMEEAPAGSNGREILTAVCTDRYLSGSIADPIAHARRVLDGVTGA